jgi:hypothetical protein
MVGKEQIDPKLAAEIKQLDSVPKQEQEKIVATKSTGHTFVEPFYKKHQTILLTIIVIIIVFILALVLIKPSQYKTSYITNSGVKFSFNFSKTAQPIQVSAQNALLGWNIANTNKLIVIADLSPFHLDCSSKSSGLEVVFKSSIYGKNVSTCSDSRKVNYLTTFQKNNVWYIVEVSSSDKKTVVDTKSAKTIISSVKVM